jgi:hypothetical protein
MFEMIAVGLSLVATLYFGVIRPLTSGVTMGGE